MSRQFDRRKQQLWLERIQRWQGSQLTIRDFCARHHLSEPNFYSWKRVLAERGLLPPGRVAAAQPDAAASPTTPLFVAATLTATAVAPQPLEIVLPDGLAVRVVAGFDAATLRQLLALLREPPC
jgi:hypothetical protein